MTLATTPTGALAARLAGKTVVLCLGSGGVGKTTTSAALALALAGRGERVVVLTIDPARRLADTLGRSGTLGNDPILVDGATGDGSTGEVWAAMLDPGETFERIIRIEAADDERAERILSNRLFRNLTTSLSGTNEYMAAERLHQLHRDPRFDRVIVDTPPSHHAMDFLDSPGRLSRFVGHRLYRSVFAPRPRILRPFHAGTQIVMRLLARLVGSELVEDVVSFFSDFEGMDQGFARRAEELEQLLRGPEAAYLLVTAPRHDRLQEASWIVGNLTARHRRLDALIVNRVTAVEPALADAAIDRLRRSEVPLAAQLEQNLWELATLARQETALIDQLRTQIATDLGRPEDDLTVVAIAEQLRPVRDLDGLRDLAALL